MIQVKNIQLENRSNNNTVRLYADFELDGDVDRLWFEVSNDLSRYLMRDCGDAFFVILVLFAHLRGQDIQFEASVSTRLYHGVVDTLLPALRKAIPRPKEIHVRAHTKDFNFSPTATGTALSLGVDSFHAFVSSLAGPFPVSHLVLFNHGTFGSDEQKARKLYNQTVSKVSQAAKELDRPLILVDSNLTRILQWSFVQTHSIRSLACVLLFPHLFQKFYYASGVPVEQFQLDGATDIARYDLLVSKAICTESLEVFIAGLNDKRIDKIDAISSFLPARHHLNVCVLSDVNEFLDAQAENVQNCSRCHKCVKTLTALDVRGKLHLYSEVFDLKAYRDKRNYNLGWMIYDAKHVGNAHAIEIIEEGEKIPGFIPVFAYAHAFHRGVRNLGRKLTNRVRTIRK